MSPSAAATREAIEAVWRIEAPRLMGGLVRFVRDVDRAEELAQEAVALALTRWPETGVPENPGAWLMAAAKNRGIDEARRTQRVARQHEALQQEAEQNTSLDETALDGVQDDVLRLILISCHPVLSKDARVALTLKLVAGLATDEIARAFLVPEPTIAQRIVRAKRTLSEARAPFEVPHGEELHERVSSALEVLYLIYNEGHSATRGDDWLRPELCHEAMRLGRTLVALVPDDAEAHGLLALMELQSSRLRTRVDANGEPVLLFDQDRSRWDRLLLRRGLAALERAESLAQPLGPYTLQAALAACHARAGRPEETDWARMVALYDALVELTGSPVVELNRAVAVSRAYGADEALPLVEALEEEKVLADYHLLPSVHGELLFSLGRLSEAKVKFEMAAALTANERERTLLRARSAACEPGFVV